MKPTGTMKKSTQQEKPLALLLGPQKNLLKRWAAALPAWRCQRYTTCQDVLQAPAWRTQQPGILLLDDTLMREDNRAPILGLSQHLGGLPILLMGGHAEQEFEVDLLHQGVRGFCEREAPATLISKAVETLRAGETWLPRRVMARVIDTLSASPPRPLTRSADQEKLVLLTPREMQVARLVVDGLNNKLIARRLTVSERTVKAHLTHIFQKLDIKSRLNLALLLQES